MKRQWRFAMAAVSGLVAVAAFPPLGWWPAALLAWPLLFAAALGAGFRTGFFVGLLHGMVLYGVSLSWLWNLFQQGAVALWLILALFAAVSCGIAGWIGKLRPAAPWLPVYAALTFAVIGHFRAEWFVLRFPWMSPGLALGPTWLSPWVGVYGAGFLVLLAAACVAHRPSRPAGVALTLCLAGLALFRPPPVRETGEGIPVLMVQSENCDFETYRQRSAAAEFSDGIILWPEYAAPMFHEMPTDRAAAAELVKSKRATLILGTTRPIDDTRRWNEALTLDERGEVGRHYKNRPVHFMADGVPGKLALPVTTRFGRIGTPVCFDCDYVDTPRRMTAAGAQFFAVPSMDAMHWSERQHLQHAELFRHRALENGRWMAVCATSGLTQVIDPHGNRTAALPLMEDGVMQSSVFRRDGLTFFTRIGWRLPQALTAVWLIATLGMVWSLRQGFRFPAG